MGSQNVLGPFRNVEDDYLLLYQPLDLGKFLSLCAPLAPHL